jgi:hypothetical protein
MFIKYFFTIVPSIISFLSYLLKTKFPMDSNEKVVKLKQLHFKVVESIEHLKTKEEDIKIFKVDDPIMERPIYKIK